MDSDLIKEKDNTQPSEATEDLKKKDITIRTTISFPSTVYKIKHWFDLDIEWIKDKFMTRGIDSSRGYTLNILKVKTIRIGFSFMFQLEMQNLQVKFNSIQTTLT